MNGARADGQRRRRPRLRRPAAGDFRLSPGAAPARTSSAASVPAAAARRRPADPQPPGCPAVAVRCDPAAAGRHRQVPVGSEGRDRLIGGPGSDRLAGKRGDDKIVGGKGGPDCLLGGQGPTGSAPSTVVATSSSAATAAIGPRSRARTVSAAASGSSPAAAEHGALAGVVTVRWCPVGTPFATLAAAAGAVAAVAFGAAPCREAGDEPELEVRPGRRAAHRSTAIEFLPPAAMWRRSLPGWRRARPAACERASMRSRASPRSRLRASCSRSYPGETRDARRPALDQAGADGARGRGPELDGRNPEGRPSPTVNADDVVFSGNDITNDHTAICFVIVMISYGRRRHTES